MQHIALFVSGTGTNAQAIIEYFEGHTDIHVNLVVTNNASSPIIKFAHQRKIISAIITNQALHDESLLLALLKAQQITFIALGGFLQKVPDFLVEQFPQRIVNIHPALLPKHGGKGMYGKHVHKAVLQNGDAQTGITIHYVNTEYDQGDIIFQKAIDVLPSDTEETLNAKVLALEHAHYAATIENILQSSAQVV